MWLFSDTLMRVVLLKTLVLRTRLSSGAECVGAIVGRSSGFITNCYALGSPSVVGVSGNRYGWGLDRYLTGWAVLIDCWVNVGVLSVDRVGGLMGQNSAAVTNCHASGNVAATASSALNHAGDLWAGKEANTIRNCYATGDVTGLRFSNRGVRRSVKRRGQSRNVTLPVTQVISVQVSALYMLVGWWGSPWVISVNAMPLVMLTAGPEDRAGGLAAQASGLVTDCYATGNVSGYQYCWWFGGDYRRQ